MRKSVCFDELKGRVRKYATVRVSVQENRTGKRLSIKHENEGWGGNREKLLGNDIKKKQIDFASRRSRMIV